MLRKLLLATVLSVLSLAAWAAPVNINTADAKTISTSLKNVGLVKAQAIVDYRTQHGAFKSAADLGKVKGIGVKTIEMNADNILLDDAK